MNGNSPPPNLPMPDPARAANGFLGIYAGVLITLGMLGAFPLPSSGTLGNDIYPSYAGLALWVVAYNLNPAHNQNALNVVLAPLLLVPLILPIIVAGAALLTFARPLTRRRARLMFSAALGGLILMALMFIGLLFFVAALAVLLFIPLLGYAAQLGGVVGLRQAYHV